MSYLAVGYDVTPLFAMRTLLPDNPKVWDWRVVHTGRTVVPLPPPLFGVWERARRGLVSYDDILASLSDEDTGLTEARNMAKVALALFPFVDWPWYDGGVHAVMFYSELFVTGPPGMLNPAPQQIPDGLWHDKPTVSELEAAIERAPGMDAGGARRALIKVLPSWLAAIPGLRLELDPSRDPND